MLGKVLDCRRTSVMLVFYGLTDLADGSDNATLETAYLTE